MTGVSRHDPPSTDSLRGPPHGPRVASATSRSSPTSTTARRTLVGPHPRAAPAPSTPATCGPSTSTRWTWSASGASRSRLQIGPRSTGRATVLHLIDTPGHVDFGYEVSRVAGRVRGRGARWSTPPRASRPRPWPTATWRSRTTSRSSPPSTRSTCRRPTPTATRPRSSTVLGIPADEILRISRQDRRGRRRPARRRRRADPAAAGRRRRPAAGAHLRLATTTSYRGVVSSVRVMNGALISGSQLRFMQAGAVHEADRDRRPQARRPRRSPSSARARSATSSPASRTWARPAPARPSPTAVRPAEAPLEGYRDPKPMVFCGLFPIDGDEFEDLARVAGEAQAQRRARFTYAPETSGALGFGFRCGFLGLLHMEIVQERLEREFDLDLIATAPSVEYRVHTHRRDGRGGRTTPPSCPRRSSIDYIEEPYFKVTILTPEHLHGHAHGAVPARAGARCRRSSTCRRSGWSCVYQIPLAEVVRRLLRPAEEPHPGLRQPRLRARPATSRSTLVKVDVLLNGVPRRRLLHDRPPRQGLRLRQAA